MSSPCVIWCSLGNSPDAKVSGIMVNWDGYPEGVGRRLLNSMWWSQTQPTYVKELVQQKQSIRILGESLSETEFYTDEPANRWKSMKNISSDRMLFENQGVQYNYWFKPNENNEFGDWAWFFYDDELSEWVLLTDVINESIQSSKVDSLFKIIMQECTKK